MGGRFVARLICAAAAAMGGGCGTTLSNAYFAPFEGGERVYGGVRLNAEVIGERLENPTPHRSPWWIVTFLVADMPLSAVADTLSLPYTLAIAAGRPVQPERPHSANGDTAAGATDVTQYERLIGDIAP